MPKSIDDKIILKFIKKARFRLNISILIMYLLIWVSAGFGVGALINIAALFVPIYDALKIAAVFVIVLTILGIVLAVIHFNNDKETALILDKRGLDERVITSYELFGKENEISILQKKNTINTIRNFNIKEKVPIKVPYINFLILVLLSISFIIAAIIPSDTKAEATKKHDIKQAVKEEKEKINKVTRDLEKIENLSDIMKEELEEQLDKAIDELSDADTLKDIEKVKERLKKKLEKSIEKEENKTTSQAISNIMDKNGLSKDGLSDNKKSENFNKAIDKLNNLQDMMKNKSIDLSSLANLDMMKELNELINNMSQEELDELMEQLKDLLGNNLTNEQLQSLIENLQNLNLENLSNALSSSNNNETFSSNENKQTGSGQNGDGQSKNGQNGSGQSENGQGESGQGESGQGENGQGGNGQGGNGKGGTGWNYGSKNGIEKDDIAYQNPEQVVIPDSVGNDDNLSGTATKDGNSYKSESQQGITWRGQSVDYDSVISEYTQDAYSKIESNQIPEAMKDVVKNYFEELNK